MKTFKIVLSGLLTMLVISTTTGQDYKNNQFTLFSYNLEISNEMRDELANIQSYFENIPIRTKYTDDILKSLMIHHVYYKIKEELKAKIELEILPINSFLDEISYNDYGYPDTNIKKAIRKGYSKYYMNIVVKIESQTEEQRKLNPELFQDIDGKVSMPVVSIEITIFNNEGIIPIDKWTGSASAAKPYPIHSDLIKGFDGKTYNHEEDDNTLFQLLDRATENLIKKVID